MKYFKDPQGQVHGFDDSDPAQAALMNQLAAGWADITGAWPAPLTAAQLHQQLQAKAQAELDKTDLVALRCFKVGVAFPAAWQAYTQALRAIVNGTDTTNTNLPAQPAYPAGT